MVGWDKDISRRVSSSFGISWNSLINLAFFEASLEEKEDFIHYTFLSPIGKQLTTQVLTNTWIP